MSQARFRALVVEEAEPRKYVSEIKDRSIDDLPPGLAETATTLEIAHGAPIVRELVVEALLESLNEVWHTLGYSPDTLVGEWEATDVLVGRNVVVVQPGGERLEGEALGIDDGGRLRLRLRYGELRHVDMADVTLL